MYVEVRRETEGSCDVLWKSKSFDCKRITCPGIQHQYCTALTFAINNYLGNTDSSRHWRPKTIHLNVSVQDFKTVCL